MFKPVGNDINFVEMEEKLLSHWYKDGVVDKYLKKNSSSKKYFSFIDGPITANNPMGVHHGWGRTYKDLWPKFFNLIGYRQRFQNGFDCQGLWVEVEVEKELGLKTKKEIENLVPGDRAASIAKFVELCKQRVLKYSAIQTEQSKRLGYFADWKNSYFTMSDENNYMIWHFLKKCYENGWIYKGKESVPWCPRCETAISQHEMLTEDYKEVTHDSIIIEFPITNFQFPNKFQISNNQFPKVFLLVWTTTPWTIPANIAVAVDKDLEYSLVEGNTGYFFWIAKDLVKKVFKGDYKRIVKTVKGEDLVGLKYIGPFDDLKKVKETAKKYPDKFHTVIATDPNILPVTVEEGTGLVHTAVSAGTEDFKLGKKYGLPMIPVIADNADYLPDLDFLSGRNAKKHPEIILDYLKTKDFVFRIERYKHRYPACWRCKTELVWKVEDEWYIAMDRPSHKASDGKQNLTLRQRMVGVAKKIKWMPEFGLDRELDWLKKMHDWLISKKNRYWGLALPIYECRKCGFVDVIGSKEELKKRAVKNWDKFEGHTPHKPFIDEVLIKCKKCGALVKRIDDVGNPWLDAGIVPYSTISENNQGEPLYLKNKTEWKKWFPADFITESFPGQFKNWFYAMIAESSVLENTNPFKQVLGYGTCLAEDGRPMHKSWGNMIEFNEAATKIGVDVMRWMYVSHNPADNLLFGYRRADEVRRRFYLILWNVYKFFVEYANLDKFKSQNLKVKSKSQKSKVNILDLWILNRFNWLIDYVERSLKGFDAKDAAIEIEKFVNDLSTWYIRRSRNRVWVNSDNQMDKDDFYNTLYSILIDLSVILSPFMPFIADKIYTDLTGSESVHLANWPKSGIKADMGILEDMNLLREIVEVGHRIRKEESIKLRQPLKKVTVFLPKNKKILLKKNLNDYLLLLSAELNTKSVDIKGTKKELIEISYDKELTNELIIEGRLRDLIRQIQGERKNLKISPEETIDLVIPKEFSSFCNFLKKRVLAKRVNIGDKLEVS